MRFGRNGKLGLVPLSVFVFSGCGWEGFQLANREQPSPEAVGPQRPQQPRPISLATSDTSTVTQVTQAPAPAAPSASLEERIREYVSRYPVGDNRRAASSAPATPPEAPANADASQSPMQTTPAVPQAPSDSTPPNGQELADPWLNRTATRAVSDPNPITIGIPAEQNDPSITTSPPTPAPNRTTEQPTIGAPPKLESIEIRPANSAVAIDAPPTPAPAPKPTTPEVAPANQPVRAQPPVAAGGSFDSMTQSLEQAVQQDPNDLASQVKLRLLYLLGGEEEKAIAPAEGISNELASLIASLMKTVAAAQASASDRNASTDEALSAIDEFRELLRSHAELAIPRVALCRRVDSFGVFEEIPTREFPGGQTTPVILYCEVENFVVEPAETNRYRTLLSQRLEVLTHDGEVVWEPDPADIQDLSRNRREDFFLAQLVHLPASLPPGEYVLNVMIEDKIGAKSNQTRLDFSVTAGK